MKRIFTAIAVTLLLSSCGSYRYVQTGKEYNSISTKDVTIITNPDKIPQDMEEVGLVICNTDNEATAYRKARKKAAQHGANIVFVKSEREITESEQVMNVFHGTRFRNTIRFVVAREK